MSYVQITRLIREATADRGVSMHTWNQWNCLNLTFVRILVITIFPLYFSVCSFAQIFVWIGFLFSVSYSLTFYLLFSSVIVHLLFFSVMSVLSSHLDRLVGLVVRRPPRERKIPGSNPACAGIFSGSSHTYDSKIGTPVATLPGAWRYRVSAGTGWPSVSIL